MTNDELLEKFPECEFVKRGDMAECIIDALANEKFYARASARVRSKADKLFLCVENKGKGYKDAYVGYFTSDRLYDWLRSFEQEFLTRHGQIRTFDEACQVAADEWVRMIFLQAMQDNGDSNPLANMFGGFAKLRAIQGYGEDVINKARDLLKDYYQHHCILPEDRNSAFYMKHPPYCDYHPNAPLLNALVSAGCDKDDANLMCPWKTGIIIDELDNSVRVKHCITERFI